MFTNVHKPSHLTPSRLAMESTIFFSTFDSDFRVVETMSLPRDSMLTTVPILLQVPTQRYNKFNRFNI